MLKLDSDFRESQINGTDNNRQTRWRHKTNVAGLPFLSIGWAGAASMILQVSTLGTSVLTARLLGIVDFGRFSIVLSTSGMFLGVAASGLGVAATRYTARFVSTDPKRVGAILALASSIATFTGAVAAGVLIILSGQIAQLAYNLPSLAPALRISALYLFFTTLNGYQAGVAVGLGAFREMVTLNAAQCLTNLMFIGILAAVARVPGATFGMGLGACIMWVQYRLTLNRLLTQRAVTLDYRNCTREMGIFWSFAMPSAISGIIGALGTWFASTLLVRTGNVKEVALFNAAIVFRQVVLFSPAIIQKVASVSLSELFGQADMRAYYKLFRQNVTYNAVVALAVAGPLFFFKAPFLRMFGKEFVDPNHVSSCVLLFAMVEVCATSIYQTIPAAGAMWLQACVMVLWASSLVGLSGLLVPRQGAFGLALAYLVTWLVACFTYVVISRILLRNPAESIRWTSQ
jgi:O-antigen/teichoic acid export membrane protein